MTDPADTTIPCADLLELARLVEQDGITSDVLPAYLQALLSVRLIEPDYNCRRAAARLCGCIPPLRPPDLAATLSSFSARLRPADPVILAEVPPAIPPRSRSFRRLLARLLRLIPLRNFQPRD